jgi:hypothetical protein
MLNGPKNQEGMMKIESLEEKEEKMIEEGIMLLYY